MTCVYRFSLGCLIFALGCKGSGTRPPLPNGAQSPPVSGAQSPLVSGARPPVVLDCEGLAATGTWQDITPPGISKQDYGAQKFAVDPVNAGIVYLGSDVQGVWKTQNCGASWTHVNTGSNAEAVDGGRHWCFGLDHEDPETLYLCNGYGNEFVGLMKSTNAGVDWEEVYPAKADPRKFRDVPAHVGGMVMDPRNPKHILIDFHEECEGSHPPYCIGETYDGGETWRLIDGDPRMVNGH